MGGPRTATLAHFNVAQKSPRRASFQQWSLRGVAFGTQLHGAGNTRGSDDPRAVGRRVRETWTGRGSRRTSTIGGTALRNLENRQWGEAMIDVLSGICVTALVF